jgi:hypothetical protein
MYYKQLLNDEWCSYATTLNWQHRRWIRKEKYKNILFSSILIHVMQVKNNPEERHAVARLYGEDEE